MTDGAEKKALDTLIADAGRRREWTGQMVNVPIVRGSTVLFDSVAELDAASPSHLGKGSYGLQGTATHWSLIEALNAMEPAAAGTVLVPSGLAAVTVALTAALSAGDDLLMVDSVYGPTRRYCDQILSRYGISVRYYDPLLAPDQIRELLRPETRAIFLESPGSQTFEVQDVPGICSVARARGVTTLIDNTWATPLFFPAIEAGVDISVQALTKYVAGHSDLLMGSISATAEWFELVRTTVFDVGHSVSADDAFLTSRGLRTLRLRLKQHEQSALAVARWLAEQPQVGAVLHPALDSCPGHHLWKRDFRGSSSLFSFELNGRAGKDAERLVDSLTQFGIGYSFGGFESLAIPVRPKRTVGPKPPPALVRLHIGLEDPADLIADLSEALRRLDVDR